MKPVNIMLALQLLLITVLPKMMNDPETKREMEQMQQQMNVNNQMPDMSELLASYFGGGAAEKPKKRPSKPMRIDTLSLFYKQRPIWKTGWLFPNLSLLWLSR